MVNSRVVIASAIAPNKVSKNKDFKVGFGDPFNLAMHTTITAIMSEITGDKKNARRRVMRR